MELFVTLIIAFLGMFAVGHLIGYHWGWLDGYWTEHPGDEAAASESKQ